MRPPGATATESNDAIMTSYQPGDKSTAVCWHCESRVTTTFVLRDVPFSDGSGTVYGVLAAVCDLCGNVVAVPARSTQKVATAMGNRAMPGSMQDVPKSGK